MLKMMTTAAAALLLSGCYSMQGSERVIGRDATVTDVVPAGAIFRTDFDRAFSQRRSGPNVQPELVDAMLSSGFTHIYSYCSNYFDVMGLKQRKSRVGRDAIAPISALIQGVLALHNFDKNPGRKEDLLAILGLATGTTASVLDIYDEHMLFGAENIGAVEKLTQAALSEHSAAVLNFNSVSFDAAVRHLLDNQAQCSPQHILSLTREAIEEGKVVAHAANAPAGTGTIAPLGTLDVGANSQGMSTTPQQDSNKKVDVSIDNNRRPPPI